MESSTPYRTLQPGEMLNWYRIERILGRGGFGVIYLATDTNLDHQVAIKEYIPGAVATRAEDSSVHPITEDHGRMFRWGMERFIKEARNLVKFKHPNIVRVMSIFQENNTAYMVMEFEEGEELRSYLKRSEANTEHNLKALILPISQGLAEVHRHGFVHRDIKPANILVRKNGSPVLLDFGSARNASRFTQQQNMTALVSAGYAPLEQYNGEGEEQQGPWTDIYALGGVLYYAISGNDPADSTRRGAAMINGGVDPLVPAVKLGQGRYSEAFLSAIDWALQFRIADRPQTLADWMPALLGDRTVADAQQTTREWVDKNQFAGGLQTRLDSETMKEMSDATVLSRERTGDMSGVLERPFPETSRKSKRAARPLAWLSVMLIAGAGAAWVTVERPELIDKVVGSLYQGESKAEQEVALRVAEQEAARKIAEEQAARKLAEEQAAAERAEAAALKRAEQQAAKLAEAEAARKQAEEEAAREQAAEAARRLADEEATRKLAEQAALQEKRRQEARVKRRLNSALANIAIAITRGELDKAQQELATAKQLGIRDSRIAARESQLTAAVAEHNKPVSDADFDTVMRMFDALKRAIEGKDITAVGRLTNGPEQTQLFEALNKRFDRIEIEISGIKVRNADKSISAQLEIESMVRSNGDRAIPSDAYRLRTIKSRRINGSWSVIEW